MKKFTYIFKLLTILTFLVFTQRISAQLITQGGILPKDLVENVLVGSGVKVLSVNYTGSLGAIGKFSNGNSTNIGLDKGVIITTGTITGAAGPQGPNDLPNAGIDNGAPGTSELGIASTYNASVLVFTFIPQGDSLLFRYVFGSEEYKEYVGTEFNDRFAFYLSGPNPLGGFYNKKNLAVLPNSTTEVAINNVNHLSNSQYYVDNPPAENTTIQYDGFTTVLEAKALLKPCEEYTIMIVIADVSDPIYDSGVFLEAKSFSTSGSDISYTVKGGFSTDTLYEGCSEAIVTFIRDGNLSQSKTIQFTVSGTATEGVDFTTLPSSITVPANQKTATLNLTAFLDGITEPVEEIVIEIYDPNACPNIPQPSVIIPVVSVDSLNVDLGSDLNFDCNNEIVEFNPNVTGGNPNYTYHWSTGSTDENIIILVREPITVSLTVTDACGQTSTDEVVITVPNAAPLTLNFSNDTAICPGTPITLNASASGGIGDIHLNWSTGDADINQLNIIPYESTAISVLAEDSCGNTSTQTAVITVRSPEAMFTYKYTANRTLEFTPQVSGDIKTYLWLFGDGDSSYLESPVHTYRDSGFYQVTLIVTNQFGCTDTVVKTVYAYLDFAFFVPNTFTPNSDGLNDVFSGKGVGFTKYELLIFNRWGENVYESNNSERGWNGQDEENERAQLGVYVYKINVTTPVGDIHSYTGNVNLIR